MFKKGQVVHITKDLRTAEMNSIYSSFFISSIMRSHEGAMGVIKYGGPAHGLGVLYGVIHKDGTESTYKRKMLLPIENFYREEVW